MSHGAGGGIGLKILGFAGSHELSDVPGGKHGIQTKNFEPRTNLDWDPGKHPHPGKGSNLPPALGEVSGLTVHPGSTSKVGSLRARTAISRAGYPMTDRIGFWPPADIALPAQGDIARTGPLRDSAAVRQVPVRVPGDKSSL